MVVRHAVSCDLPALFAVFDAFGRNLPHGFPVGPDEFFAWFSGQPAHLRTSSIFVAVHGGVPVGFMRAGVYRTVGDRWSFAKPGEGLLFGPFVAPDHADAGYALISASARSLRERSVQKAVAFDPIESVGAPCFNGGWTGLSERRPQIIEMYTNAGFRLRYRELCLQRSTMTELPPAPPIPPPLTFSVETRDNGRLSVKLYDRGVLAGACHYCRMYPRRACHPNANHRGYIDGLAVPEDYQGRGLGRLALVHALHRLREMGCDSVGLTTASDNFKAQNLYYSLGFRVVDSCVSLVSLLDGIGPSPPNLLSRKHEWGS